MLGLENYRFKSSTFSRFSFIGKPSSKSSTYLLDIYVCSSESVNLCLKYIVLQAQVNLQNLLQLFFRN